jgi:hypothetical protein
MAFLLDTSILVRLANIFAGLRRCPGLVCRGPGGMRDTGKFTGRGAARATRKKNGVRNLGDKEDTGREYVAATLAGLANSTASPHPTATGNNSSVLRPN